jgi:hypothetical protein
VGGEVGKMGSEISKKGVRKHRYHGS